ncbi:MAG: glutamine-hydrolyzing carbamoyl-phosphate synthase small subunit [Ardenticatenales bacterium]|nr:glutamine-hydrolyzing carbamoyl-phosphate synthase small subunit [Ardenticatenales bacterium]
MTDRAYLALVDGSVWAGHPYGARGQRTGEVVFNTSMTGYQEVLTDPSYCRQIVVMTAPHIGNTGVNADDDESARIWVAGYAMRRGSPAASSWRATDTLDAYLRAQAVPGITDLDTRAIVRHLRDRGAMHGAIVSDGGGPEDAVRLAKLAPDINLMDLVGEVSCAAPYAWTEGADPAWMSFAPGMVNAADDDGAPHVGPHIVVYDYGVKRNTLRLLAAAGCRVTVVPARWPAAETLAMHPDGVLLSNGPGDPAALHDVIACVRQLVGHVPLFGICLGHQLLGLALGGRTFKLKFGHRGGNQPVKQVAPLSSMSTTSTSSSAPLAVAITSQNHGFALSPDGLPGDVVVSHVSLNDGSVEGLAAPSRRAFSVQYHPEAAPGPHDAVGLFGAFLGMVRSGMGVRV